MSVRAMLQPALLAEYPLTAARILRRRIRGHRRFEGGAVAICRSIVDACWTGQYLAASAGHFRQFWTRDLAYSAEALVRLGAGQRVRASLAWALDAWAREGRVTTTIFPGRRPADVFTYGVDSLPLLLHALRAVDGGDLVGRHADWLAPELRRYAATVLDPATGLVRDDRRFSTHRDTVRTRSNAYANTMVALLERTLGETGWLAPSPIPAGAVERFRAAFLRDGRIVERPDGDEVTGDATVFPFFLGVLGAGDGLRTALRAAEAAGLTEPLPLRYTARRDPHAEDPVQRLYVPDYQGTAIWTSLGAMELALLRSVDPRAAAPGIAAYRALVERDGTVWEVLDGRDRRLRPYRGRLGIYIADEGMLWSALLEDLFEAAP